MGLDHQFINKVHFFKAFEDSDGKKLDQSIEIMIKTNCACEYGGMWGVGGVCSHLKTCFGYLMMKPKERLKFNIGDITKYKKNRVLGLVRLSNRKVNVIRKGENESKKHAELKEQICNTLLLLNIDFVTEAIIEFKSVKQRADILVPELGLVIEVAVSESDDSLANKAKVFSGLGLEMKIVR